MLRFAGFELDPQRAELRGPTGDAIKLRRKSFDVLQMLASRAGQVLGKDEIVAAVWPNVHVGEDSLYQCIREVRAALGDERREIIKVVPARGYLFAAEVTEVRDSAEADAVDTATAGESARAHAIEAKVLPPNELRGVRHLLFRRAALVAIVAAVCAAGLAIAAPLISSRIAPQKAVIAIAPIVAAGADAEAIETAANVTARLTDGLSGIPNIRVLAPGPQPAAGDMKLASASEPRADFVVQGELQRTADAWRVEARMLKAATGEVQWSASHSVPVRDIEPGLRQSRLAGGIGYPLAQRISESTQASVRSADAQAAVDQALAALRRYSRENFSTAQTMLEKSLAAYPDDVDLQATLAAHLLRGIQLVWFAPAEADAAGRRARELLEQALKRKADYMPVLQTYCRFLVATNEFTDGLVTCAKALRFNPWDGMVIYHIGLAELQLGRFDDALTSFEQADRADMPQVSRWVWLLGAGLASEVMGRDEEAISWLKRSLAISSGTGRTHFVLAAAYQRLGRTEEAKAAVAAGLALRPGSTVTNIALPARNASPLYLEKVTGTVRTALLQAGLPP